MGLVVPTLGKMRIKATSETLWLDFIHADRCLEGYVCVYEDVCVCLCMCVCKCTMHVETSLLPQLLSTLFFETRMFTEPVAL